MQARITAMPSPDPSELEAWFVANRQMIEALINEGCTAVERGEPIDSDDAHSKLKEMKRAKFPRFFSNRR
jgi:hypothetical protein